MHAVPPPATHIPLITHIPPAHRGPSTHRGAPPSSALSTAARPLPVPSSPPPPSFFSLHTILVMLHPPTNRAVAGEVFGAFSSTEMPHELQTMHDRSEPRGGSAPSTQFIVDEHGKKWYPVAVPAAGGFTIDYTSQDPNLETPPDAEAPSNNPADYYVPRPRTTEALEANRLPQPTRSSNSWWSTSNDRARTVPSRIPAAPVSSMLRCSSHRAS